MLMRGGTSKGLYFLASDLPAQTASRDRVLLAAMGSPDLRQIDGLGGGDDQSSKVIIVEPSARPGVDVDFLFAQVSVARDLVDATPNSGNMLAGVAPFALERGVVRPAVPTTLVRIFDRNTGKIVEARVHTPGGRVAYQGSFALDGVPGTSAPIELTFIEPAGGMTGKLLPTDSALDVVDGIPVTCIDFANPIVIVAAADLGKTGHETKPVLDADAPWRARLERLRRYAARLMGLSVEQTRRALGIAASEAAGLRENFGTMTKPFHAGRAAESGVVAAELVQLGFTASPIGLEADRGFFRAAGGGFEHALIMGQLGAPWTFHSPGVSIKPHPSGSLTHPGMSVMLDLIHQYDLRPESIRRVSVGTNHNMPNALIHHRPRNELQAKFSMEFCMAILLLERKAGLEEFTGAVVNRSDVQAMIRKIDFGIHPEAEAAGFDKMTTIIEVELDDGSKVRGAADFGKGSPANPMSDDELADKFRGCARWGGLDRDTTERILDLAWRIDELDDLRDLTRLLRITQDRKSVV